MKLISKIALCALAAVAVIFLITQNSPDNKQITGKVIGGSAEIRFAIIPKCSILLGSGWNFVSFCANITDKSVESVLSSINNSYRYVMEWNESSQSFMIYSPLSSAKPFTEINPEKSYFIYFQNSSGNINLNGTEYDLINVSLLFGWNTPTYPYVFNTTTAKFISLFGDQFRYIMKWNSSTQSFMIYSPLSAQNPFYDIEFGEGLFLYVTNSSGATIVYRQTALQ